MALTDHGEVNQHLAFQKACKAEGIKSVFGMEGYWAADIQAARDASLAQRDFASHICLIAQDDEGLKNLWALSSTAYDAAHHYRKPLADPELLRTHAKGLYASDGCIMTMFGHAVKRGDEDAARQYLAGLQDIFKEKFYVELHTWQYMHPGDDEVMWEGVPKTTSEVTQLMTDLNQAKVRLAIEMGISMVVVNDAHHAYPEHWRYKELVWGFKNEVNPDQAEGNGQKADHMMGDDELVFWMDRHGISREIVTAAIEYSGTIADSCHAEIKPMLGMPLFSKLEADDFEQFLVLVERGFRDKIERGGLDRDTYWTRMESEIALIAEKRFAGYFLIVADYVSAAREGTWASYVNGGPKQPMLIGPGRGSAGGSLVAWLLGITSIDPIKYDLLFERFLIRERKGFPDIDIDFPRSKRKYMKEYVQHRWGHDRVCAICTMTRNKARGTVKDLGRQLGIDYKKLEEIGALIERITAAEIEEEESSEDREEKTWAELVEEHQKELGPLIAEFPDLFRDVAEVTGVIRQTGVHAAAVLITPADKPLREVLPTRIKKGTLTTQFDMYDVEELGGLKGDFLALRHLDALQIAADLVKERHGVEIDYEAFTDEHYHDPAIWAQIDEGQTTGVFQLGTPGGTESAIEFRPRSMEEVADLISINRPGVRDAGLYNAYLRRRAGVEAVSYQHPMMAGITSTTFGILVYQEQLMQTARELAGFTAAEADDLRKAVGKKIMEKVVALKSKFVQGCIASEAYMSAFADNPTAKPKEVSETIWRSIEASGRYCFNKSHAIGYAMISHREIWMKHYYLPEMLVGFMQVDEAKRNKFIRDARRHNITILPPDINLSGATFKIQGDTIRYGVDAVTQVGEAAATKIIAAQPYTSVEDFLLRGKPNKTVALNLAMLGALDCLTNRTAALKEIEWHRACEGLAKSTLGNPDKLNQAVVKRFEENPTKWRVPIPDFTDENVVYEIEKQLIGSFVTIDPMGLYLRAIDSECIRTPAAIRHYIPGQLLKIGGQIIKVHKHKTKKGRNSGAEMCFLGVEWQGDVYDIVVFPKAYEQYKLLLKMGRPVICVCERLDSGVCLTKLLPLDLIWDEYGN